MTQRELLLKIMYMVLKSGVCPDTPKPAWARILIDAHNRGYLHVLKEHDTIYSVCCGYRTPDVWDTKVMPDKEEGDNLYVAWCVSTSNGINRPLRMLRGYLKQNPDIKRVYYHRRNNDKDLKEWRINHVK